MSKFRLASFAIALSTLPATAASASQVHTFAGPVWYQPTSLADEAITITLPAEPPQGTEYAWLSAVSGQGFTQVGWAWHAGGTPHIFAYTDPPGDWGCQCHGRWAIGPSLQPGGSVTVRIVAAPNQDLDQVLVGSRWQTVQWAPATNVLWSVLAESYDPMNGPICFSGLVPRKTCWA